MEVGLLLVDDRRDTIEPLIPTLEERFAVAVADRADDALRLWQADERLRAGLIDLNLSGDVSSVGGELGGFDLIAQLKAIRPPARLAVHSAYASHEKLAQAARLGADGFVIKASHPDRLRGCVNHLHFWATSWGAFPDLAHAAQSHFRCAAGPGGRVAAWCRALLPYLPNATPKNFDLAACLLAAEVHDLCKLLRAAPPDASLFQGGAVGEGLRALGIGFDKVANVLELHGRCYARPPEASLPDHPTESPSLPRGDALPLESRLLRLADAVDGLLAGPAAHSSEQILTAVRQDAERGSFDPKLVSALEALLRADPAVLTRFGPP